MFCIQVLFAGMHSRQYVLFQEIFIWLIKALSLLLVFACFFFKVIGIKNRIIFFRLCSNLFRNLLKMDSLRVCAFLFVKSLKYLMELMLPRVFIGSLWVSAMVWAYLGSKRHCFNGLAASKTSAPVIRRQSSCFTLRLYFTALGLEYEVPNFRWSFTCEMFKSKIFAFSSSIFGR